MILSADFMPLLVAEALTPKPGQAMISIVDPSHNPAFSLAGWPASDILYLRFDDRVAVWGER